jgi:nicotinate-nucleotide adenylyltransferase
MKWGLFGGTFDPIHFGHLRCAEEVRELLELDRVLFVPASRPPHKPDRSITPFQHREQMVRLAIEGNPAFSLSDVEDRREGFSYSIETVENILATHGMENSDLTLILGQDAFHLIRTWKEWERLLLLCNFAVMTRPGCLNQGLETILTPEFAARFVYDPASQGFRGPTGRMICFREVTFLAIASSAIRKRVGEGKTINYLIPEAVRQYITTHALYRNPQPLQ